MSKKGPKEVTGLDIAPESIQKAEANYNRLKTKNTVNFRTYDGRKIPFEDNSFDVIFSIGVIHHAEDDLQVIKEAYRVLAPGGRFVGCVYRKNSPGFFIRNAIAANRPLKRFIKPGTRNTFLAEIMLCPLARHYTANDWKKLLSAALFKENKVWKDFSGLERWMPTLGRFVDKATMGKLGYYVLWNSTK
jgi:ubiquinone/menaquinone biosynthesis C-methylase UbiE